MYNCVLNLCPITKLPYATFNLASCYFEVFNIVSGVSRISFRGGVQNFSGKVGEFSAWRSHAFVRGVRGHAPAPEKILKNGAIWCVLESILLKFCQKNIFKNSHFLYKNNR